MKEDVIPNNLYASLLSYGNVYPSNNLMNANDFLDWTLDNFNYVRYNPDKDISRYGLSITSMDGGLSGIPDLDTLKKYPQYNELDFKTPTPVYDHPEVKKALDPIKDHIFRTHIIRLDSGGYFPPHRDSRKTVNKTFRLIIPLRNVNPPEVNFVFDDKIFPRWEIGRMYFINTNLMHYLFNASANPSYWIVINTKVNEISVRYIAKNMKYWNTKKYK